MSRSVSAQMLIVVVLVSAIAGSGAGFAFAVVLLKTGPVGPAGPAGPTGLPGDRGHASGVGSKAVLRAIQANPAPVAAAIQADLRPSLSDLQVAAEGAQRAAVESQSDVRRLRSSLGSLCSALSVSTEFAGRELRC